jgi:hypothetical protein
MGWPFDSLIDRVYLPLFNKYGEPCIKSFINSSVSKMAFLSAYKKIPPIETLPDNEMGETMAYVNDLFPDKTEEEKLEACKIIYTIGNRL